MFLDVLIMLGVAMTMSTVFMTARHSLDDLPRMQSVQPLHIDPRISYEFIAEDSVRLDGEIDE